MKPTFYLRKLLTILHLFGLLRLPNYYDEQWQSTLHLFYWGCTHSVMSVAILSNITSTFVYSTRNLAEFLQRLFESISFCGYYYETVLLNIKLTQLLSILDKLDNSFCTVQSKMFWKCKREERTLMIGCFILVINTILATFIEAFFLPLDEVDRALIKTIYNRQHGRKLPVNLYVPGIDISEPMYFLICSFFTVYLAGLLVVLGTVCFCNFPLFVMNVELQIRVLSRYVRMIGKIHQNPQGDVIRYTNIINDEYVLQRRHEISRSYFHDMDKIVSSRDLEKYQHGYMNYEELFTRQIFKFHQKLLLLREEYIGWLHMSLVGRALFSMALLALAVYQVFSRDIYSEKTVFKYCLELTCVVSCYFYFCHISERWQGCNDHVRRAMEDSCWYQCSSRVQKNVIMMHVRTYRSVDYVEACGIFRASYEYYVSSLKLSYSFLNFVKLQERSSMKAP
ncbi:hypothetical protein M8J76_006775 [Diaphorina citri]|nr:hypothetical protein M8J75_014163 [Diaphorina citri]KAI5749364.1 hypothetical protein M8J76_006775 [Diaphorina citri]